MVIDFAHSLQVQLLVLSVLRSEASRVHVDSSLFGVQVPVRSLYSTLRLMTRSDYNKLGVEDIVARVI